MLPLLPLLRLNLFLSTRDISWVNFGSLCSVWHRVLESLWKINFWRSKSGYFGLRVWSDDYNMFFTWKSAKMKSWARVNSPSREEILKNWLWSRKRTLKFKADVSAPWALKQNYPPSKLFNRIQPLSSKTKVSSSWALRQNYLLLSSSDPYTCLYPVSYLGF